MELLAIIKDIIVALWEYLKFVQYNFHWEEAIIMRAGKYHRSKGPGIHLKWPIYEYCHSANVKQDTMEIEPVAITTEDNLSVEVGLVIVYYVSDIRLFLTENNDSLSNAMDISRGEVSELLEDKKWEYIKKKATNTALLKNIQEKFNSLGIKIDYLKFTTKVQIRGHRLFSDRGNKVHPTLNV